MAAGRGLGLAVLVIVAGLIIGSWLGEVMGAFLPPGLLQEVLTRGPTVGLTTPATLDLRFIVVTFGLTIRVNAAGALGVVIAALALRRL